MDHRQLDVTVTTEDDKTEQPKPQEHEQAVEPEPTPAEETAEDENRPDNPIRLCKPIIINGKERRELTWDEDITVDQFLQADSLTHTGRTAFNVAEVDSALQYWLGAMMVVAANPEIDPKDLEQVRGRDIFKVMRVGRFLMQAANAD